MQPYVRSFTMIWLCIVVILFVSDAIDVWILGHGEPAWSPLKNMLSRVLQAVLVALVLALIAGSIVIRFGRSQRSLETRMSLSSGLALGLYCLGWTIAVNHLGFSPSVLQLFLGLLIVPAALGVLAALLSRSSAT